MSNKNECFRYTEINVSKDLPANWQVELLDFTRRHMEEHVIRYSPDNDTTREISRDIHIPSLVVYGDVIKEGLPWLYEFYQTKARALMQDYFGPERVICAEDMMYAINLQAAYDVDDHGHSMHTYALSSGAIVS